MRQPGAQELLHVPYTINSPSTLQNHGRYIQCLYTCIDVLSWFFDIWLSLLYHHPLGFLELGQVSLRLNLGSGDGSREGASWVTYTPDLGYSDPRKHCVDGSGARLCTYEGCLSVTRIRVPICLFSLNAGPFQISPAWEWQLRPTPNMRRGSFQESGARM